MITNPESGPKPIPIPEPVPHVVPRMGGTIPQPAPAQMWRVTESELDKIEKWLVPELRKAWPRMHEEGIHFWFKSAIGDRRTLFIRTKNVVGMFHIVADVLEPVPVVVEKFVRERVTSKEESALLYTAAKDWARVIGAREMKFDLDSDSAMQTHIVPALGTLETPVRRRTYYNVLLKPE